MTAAAQQKQGALRGFDQILQVPGFSQGFYASLQMVALLTPIVVVAALEAHASALAISSDLIVAVLILRCSHMQRLCMALSLS